LDSGGMEPERNVGLPVLQKFLVPGGAGSELPVPSRRTLAAGILPSARYQGRLDWQGQPLAVR